MEEKDPMAGETITEPPKKSIDERVKEAEEKIKSQSKSVSVSGRALNWSESTVKQALSTTKELIKTGELLIFSGLIITSNWWLSCIRSAEIKEGIVTTLLTIILAKATLDKRNEVIQKKIEAKK